MTECVEPVAEPTSTSAGALLKAARQRQGMHIAVVAAGLKVAQAKLESLEADRYGELPDATFTRALAQSVCRLLKIDPQPVLILLPSVPAHGLERVDGGLNAPFRERPGRIEPSSSSWYRQPTAWAVAAMLVAAAGVMWWPQWQRGAPQGQDAQLAMPTSAVSAGSAVASAGSADGAASSASVPAPAGSAREAALAQPGLAAQPSASLSAQGTGSSLVTLRAVAVTWVEVAESSGQVLLSRHLQPGESASTQGRPPLTVRIGNAQGTQLEFRGQQVDLRPATRDNVTRIELN